ncbi:MAG: hypothetical protein ACFHU9_12840 [Fluviicola sp.]
MNNVVFLLTLLFIPFTGQSQTIFVTDQKSENIPFFTITYGQDVYLSDFGNNFNSFGNYTSFQPIQSVGVMLNVYEPKERQHVFGNMTSYSQIIPQDMQINDSLMGRINGFNLGLTIMEVNLTPKMKWSAIGLGFGFNTGRLRVKSDGYRSRKNPYWAPALFFNPHFIIKKFVVGLAASYQFDVTRRRWQPLRFSSKTADFELDEFRQTGFTAKLSVGFKL